MITDPKEPQNCRLAAAQLNNEATLICCHGKPRKRNGLRMSLIRKRPAAASLRSE